MNRANQHRVARRRGCSVGRLGGYYDLRYYRGCDHLVGNTRGIVDWLRRSGWPAERTHYLPNFVDEFAATPAADRAPRRAAGATAAARRSAACIPTRGSTH